LKAGDVLDFDENAPFLKATKVIPPEAWEQLGTQWRDPWPGLDARAVLEEIRGPVENPPASNAP